MKHLKILGLAVVAAMALTALLGAGTALATRLCSANQAKCAAPLAAGTKVKANLKAGTNSVLKAGVFTVTCGESTAESETTNAGGGKGVPVTGELKTLTFNNCGGTEVVVKHPPPNVKGEVNSTGGGNGSLLVKAGVEVKVKALGVECFYGGEVKAKLNVVGGNPALMKAEKAEIQFLSGSPLCDNKAIWEAEYEVTAPKPLFIAEE